MKFRRSFLQVAALLLAAAAVLPACSSSGTAKDEPKASDSEKPVQPQPITLKVMNGLYNEKDWQTIVVEPLKKKFPHITLDQGSGVARTYDQKFLEETIAAGNTPDIVLSGVAQSSLLVPLGLAQDLAPFIKKNQIDMNAYDNTTVETLKKYSPIFNMETVTLPLYINFKVLLYNKDLFDKFAVPYPKNHMTHNDAIELSKKLTRMDGGIQYYGYAADSYINLGGQYSLNYIERQTNKVNLSGLEKVFPVLKEVMDIPGMQGVSTTKAFNTDKTLAMYNEWLASVVQNAAVYKDMKWGMVTYPEFKDRPYQTEVDFHSSYMTKTTKYPDQAFQVMSWMMQSEEIQSLITRSGKVTVLKNKEITSLWGKDSGLGTEEALKAILETKMAPSHDVHPLDRKGTVIAPLATAYTAYLNGTKDLNVALRDAADEMQKLVNTELGK
ncbi:ABC transporter substrate-binding protein [Paenibacillus hemerocallicola]|uniref:ABC transporter substrate-binding protein n=1 Tax=Paenibacillus hemerocallicola TaxID=1172614 RepID=UPI00159EC096|nr:extracellular solute-binding protein [Paenibacillus hemerocallicola]